MEEFATNYVINGQFRMMFDSFLLFAAGGIVSLILPKYQFRITNSHYFCISGILFFVNSLHLLLLENAAEAIVAGRAWILMLESMASWFVYGLVTGPLAAARSRDAYGHSQKAILAFIPAFNLWLYGTRSRDVSAAVKPIWLMRGFAGVLIGIVLFASGNAVVKEATSQRFTGLSNNKELPIGIYAQFIVNNLRLKDALDSFYGNIKVPIDADMTTTLVGVDVDYSTVKLTYRVGLLGAMIGVSESKTIRKICEGPINLPFLRAGATFKNVLNDQNGREIANVTVTAKDCGL